MYQITIEKTFAAAHAITLYDGSVEPVHGHNWPVTITVEAKELDQIEVVMDFHELERHVDALLARAHNKNLNDIEPFADGKLNPTAERVAWWIATELAPKLPEHARLVSVSVGEAPGCTATFVP